jgi:hypothetical protein
MKNKVEESIMDVNRILPHAMNEVPQIGRENERCMTRHG